RRANTFADGRHAGPDAAKRAGRRWLLMARKITDEDPIPIGGEMRMLYLFPEEDWLRYVANERALYALCKAGAGWETIEVLPRDGSGAQEVRAIKTREPRTIDDMYGDLIREATE